MEMKIQTTCAIAHIIAQIEKITRNIQNYQGTYKPHYKRVYEH